MAMIKRGHSDTGRPSVISSSKKCSKCGYVDATAVVCPRCQGGMIEAIVDTTPDAESCPSGICPIHKI